MTTKTVSVPSIVVERHLGPGDLRAALCADVRNGLTARPKQLPPKWFYDARGGQLFDEITRLPEYYPTRTERSLLTSIAGDVARLSGADTLVELGSGTSEKTRLLLGALRDAGTLQRFVPFDVDITTLTMAGLSVAAEFPGVQVQAVVGDFERHVALLPREGRRLIAFLGSTIGNLEPRARSAFLRSVAGSMAPGEHFLLGTDLVKDERRLIAAYDDSAGVTAQFNKNVLAVINRELGADFDLDGFDHVAIWDAEREWIEMRLRARQDMTVSVHALGLEVAFSAAEQMRTEISAKFRRTGVERELAQAGLRLAAWWTDPAGDVALALAERA